MVWRFATNSFAPLVAQDGPGVGRALGRWGLRALEALGRRDMSEINEWRHSDTHTHTDELHRRIARGAVAVLGLTATVATCTLATSGAAFAASARHKPVSSLAHSFGGVALPGSKPIDPTVNVGGGTWDYGTGFTWYGGKYVWSDYFNPHYYHDSTAIIGSDIVPGVGNPGEWSFAKAYGLPWQTGYAYWSNL